MIYAFEQNTSVQLVFKTPSGVEKIWSDETGEALFNFADMDMEPVTRRLLELFQTYVDIDTLETRAVKHDDADSLQIIHPFFLSADHLTTLSDLLAGTYTALLIERNVDLTEKKFNKNISSFLHAGRTPDQYHDQRIFQGRFYEAYKTKHKPSFTIASLASFQKYVKNYFYWVLDATASRFTDIDTESRLRLFGNVFGPVNRWQPLSLKEVSCVGLPEEDIVQEGIWKLIEAAQSGGDISKAADKIIKKKTAAMVHRSYAAVLEELSSDDIGLDSDMTKWLNTQMAAAKEDTAFPLFKAYEIKSFMDYVLLQLRLFTEKLVCIKRCKNCGQLFITDRTNIDYCQRILPGEKRSCYSIGPHRVYNKLLSDDQYRNAYAKAYKRNQARLRRNTLTKTEFEEWKASAKEKLAGVQDGTVNPDEYTEWMER